MRSALASLENEVRLSPGERKLITLLPPSGKRVSTEDLAARFYDGKQEPFNSRLVVVGLVRSLRRKISKVRSPALYVHRSDRAGPYPMQVWRSNSAAD